MRRKPRWRNLPRTVQVPPAYRHPGPDRGCLLHRVRKSFLRSARSVTVWTRFFDALFVTIALLVLVLILAIGMTSLRDRWLLPFLFLMPIYFCLKMQASGVRPVPSRASSSGCHWS